MTPAEHAIVVACCSRAAELWAQECPAQATQWFRAAVSVITEADGDFVDTDEQADR